MKRSNSNAQESSSTNKRFCSNESLSLLSGSPTFSEIAQWMNATNDDVSNVSTDQQVISNEIPTTSTTHVVNDDQTIEYIELYQRRPKAEPPLNETIDLFEEYEKELCRNPEFLRVDLTLNDQIGGAPVREIDRICNVQYTTRRVRRRGHLVNISIQNLTFPHLENMTDPINITLPAIFNQFMDDCLSASGVADTQNAPFCISLNHPSFDKGTLYCAFRTRANFDGTALLNLFSKIQQSKRDMILNEELTAEMDIYDAQPVEEDLLPGARNRNYYFDQDLGIVSTVKNPDKLCLAKACAVGMMKVDINLAKDDEEIARTKNKCRNYIQRWTPPLHEELLTKAGIALDKNSYDLRDLEKITEVYSDYRFILYTRPPGQALYTIRASYNDKAKNSITLGYHKNHYDWLHVTTERGMFASLTCPTCKILLSGRLRNHVCKAKCSKCHCTGCIGTKEIDGFKQKCPTCSVSFYSQRCFDNHKGSVCRFFKCCQNCDAYYKIRNDRPHVCNTAYCNNCKQLQPKEHKCCWPAPSIVQRNRAKKWQEKYKIVFYDFETVVLADGEDLTQYAEEQWPNLVAYSRFCNLCQGRNECIECGVREGYFRYQNGDNEWSVTDRFLDWILYNPINGATIFIAHNGSRFDTHFLLNRLLHREIYPHLVMNGTQIITMSIEPLQAQRFNKVIFKDSCLLVPLPLAALPKAFGINDISKGEFPYLFNHPINYHKVLPRLPDRKYFCTDRKKADALIAFNQWYDERANNEFDFDKELLEYCQLDVRILGECLKKYMLLAIELTGWNPIVHCATFASFSLFQLKMNHMKDNQVGVLPENGYMANQRQSKIALQYIRWLEDDLGYQLIHKLNGGEHRVVTVAGQRFLLDAYDPNTNTAYEINGCYFHGCPQCTCTTARSPSGNTMLEAYEITKKREELIQSTGINVVSIWEHEIREQLKSNLALKNFMKGCNVVTRLHPRDAFLGGRTQTYRMLVESDTDYELEYVDFCSLYPYVTAFVAEYPIGGPTVITDNFDSFENGCPYKGLVKCDVLPPRNLLYPVIGSRIGGKLIFANCRTCAENAENDVCRHEDVKQRQLHTTITHIELACAIARGYKVLRVYEVWNWDHWETGGLFKEFVQKYIKIKQEATGWPKPDMTEEEKAKFLSDHEEHVGVSLDADNISRNPAMRSIAKLQLNSVWGKLGQRCDKSQTILLSNTDTFIASFINDPEKEITGFKSTDKMVYISWRPRNQYLQPTKFTNVAIAAYTTAHARLLLYKAMEKIDKKLVYTDTDSLIYLKHKTNPDPIADMRGEWLGKLTSEIPNDWKMIKFVSPAAKVYSYILQNEAGELKSITKAKGVTLDHCAASMVNFDGMEQLVHKLVDNGISEELNVKTSLIRRDLGHIRTVDMYKRTRVVMDKLCYKPDYTTLPYGYIANNS